MTDALGVLLAVGMSPEKYEVCNLRVLPRPTRSECSWQSESCPRSMTAARNSVAESLQEPNMAETSTAQPWGDGLAIHGGIGQVLTSIAKVDKR